MRRHACLARPVNLSANYLLLSSSSSSSLSCIPCTKTGISSVDLLLVFLSSCFLLFIPIMAGLRRISWTCNCHFFPRKCLLELKWNPELRLTQFNQMHWTEERFYINRQPFVSWLRAATLGTDCSNSISKQTEGRLSYFERLFLSEWFAMRQAQEFLGVLVLR